MNRSMVVPKAVVVTPDLILPGQRKIAGTRKPPSQVLTLPSKKGPAEPPFSFWLNHGPLSEVKTTSVFSSIPSWPRVCRIWPADQSISSIVSP